MIKYSMERPQDVEKEIIPLLLEHNKETNLFSRSLNPDWELYRDGYETGHFRILTMRKDSKLVGYAGFFLSVHKHHIHSVQAEQDIFYIKKGHRGRCIHFLTYCHRRLKKLGVEYVHQSVPVINDWSPVLLRAGYTKLEEIYLKKI